MVARHKPPDVPAGAEFVACDATHRPALLRALEGCTVVANLSAGRPADIECIAGNLKTAMRLQRFARLIHVSSLAIFGARAGEFDEASSPCPHPSHRYAVSKVRAEKLLEPHLAAGCCVIVRPGCIYGQGAPVWTNRVGRMLLGKRLGDIGRAGAGIAPLVHVESAACAIVAAITAPAGVYHLLPQEEISWNEYFHRFARALGMSAVAKLTAFDWAIETSLRSPARMVHAQITGQVPDVITPAMRRMFATPGRAIAYRTLGRSNPLGSDLPRALADAARAIRSRAEDARRGYATTSTVNIT
jgi:nucleoside-diphosphate-sugar epimerase